MENDSGSAGSVTPDAARHALGALAADRAALADRVRTPAWYHPVLGAIVAAFVASPAVSSSSLRSVLVVFGCVGLVLVIAAFKRVTGFSVSRPAGPRSTACVWTVLVLVVTLFFGSMALVATGAAALVAATTTAGFLVVVVGGRLYDRAFRRELRAEG